MTAPGWYNDERDPSLARWHDGTGWTEHTMRKADWHGPGAPPPPGVEPRPPVPGARPGPERAAASAPPEPPASPASPATSRRTRERPSGHLVAAIASLVVILVCLLVLQSLHDRQEEDAAGSSTTTVLPGYPVEWTTKEGGRYRVTITPSSARLDQPSPSGCVGAPAPGTTNLAFDIHLENLSPTEEAPIPQIAFGLNTDPSGQLDPSITSLDHATTEIEIGPVAAGSSCSQAKSIVPGSGNPLPPGGATDYTGVVGGAPVPVPNGLGIIVRVFQADPTQVARGTGFSPLDSLAPFPPAEPG